MTQRIEQVWAELQGSGDARQRRIDADHPHDIYADFQPPDQPGICVVCNTRPRPARPLRAIAIDQGERSDGRWALRITLQDLHLLPVFAAFCDDIVRFTRTEIAAGSLASAVASRIDRWRNLLERGTSGLGAAALRGLIGELLVLELEEFHRLALRDAVAAWTGPYGTPQDFLVPSGMHMEVKAIGRDARTVHINGLGQLDAGDDPLVLLVVRLEVTGPEAQRALTAGSLISRIRGRLATDADALATFEAALAFAGWHAHPSHDEYAVRPIVIEAFDVDSGFPRLVARSVPQGVQDADYTVTLPSSFRTIWRADP